jgi:hypothetical protein
MPRNVGPRDQEEAQRAYIVPGEEIESKRIYYPEDSVVKDFDRLNTHVDNWAIHELKEVTAKDKDGKIINLLFCARDGHEFKVTGQIIVDAEFKQYRK